MTQVYMNIHDMTPTETLWDEVDDRKLYKDGILWKKDALIADIRENGIKYALNVDPDGFIKNGNARYWVARKLLEEGDQRFLYLPVQRNYAAGAFVTEMLIRTPPGVKPTPANVTKIMNDITSKIASHWINYVRDLVEPSKKELTNYEVDPENHRFLIDKWKQNLNKWAILSNPSPHNKRSTFIIGIIGKSEGRKRNQLTSKQIKSMITRKL